MKILVVDDDPSIQGFAVAVLTKVGFEVEQESNGNEAFRAYRKRGPYDLVLTDIDHPGMNGLDLAKAIRKKNRTQAIAFVTAASYLGSAETTFLDNLASDYWMWQMTGRSQSLPQELKDIAVLGKPFRVQHLLNFVETNMAVPRKDGLLGTGNG